MQSLQPGRRRHARCNAAKAPQIGGQRNHSCTLSSQCAGRTPDLSDIIQVERSSSQSDLSKEIKAHFSGIVGAEHVKCYSLKDLEKVNLPAKSITISLLELEEPLLAVMTPEEMDLVRKITDTTTDLVWLTGASYMDGTSPSLSLASGLSRALMLEQPSLRFVILDIGVATQMSKSNRTDICSNIDKALFADDVPDDKEFVLKNGLLHISRFVPDAGLNSRFSQRRNQQPSEMTLEAASPAKLEIKKVGIMDTIYFQQESETEIELPDDHVDIDVKAVSLNAKVGISGEVIKYARLIRDTGYLRPFW